MYSVGILYYRLLLVIFILFSLTQCVDSDNTTKPISDSNAKPQDFADKFDSKYNSKNYIIRNYIYPKYSYNKKKYRFQKIYAISPSDLKDHLNYYRVYYTKDTKIIDRIDTIESNRVKLITLIKYDDKKNRIWSYGYISKNNLDHVGIYKNNVLITRKKLKNKDKVQFISLLNYIKQGMREDWYTPKKVLSFTIFYNHFQQEVRFAQYNNGLLQKIIDYKYNAKNQLEAEYYFNPSRKPLGYKEYKYHTDGNLKLSNTYLGKKLSLTTEYDNFGRVIKIEKYNKQEMVINQTRTSYNDNGRTERIYNKNNILITKANYTSDNQLKELIKYDNDREIYSEVYDFENGVKKSGKILSFGNLIKQFDYDANGILVKESKLNQGKLISYTVYKYNDKGLISDATQYSSSNKVLSDWKYHYTKKNQISKEETYIGNKLLFKSIYSYNNSGHKTSTKFYKENLPIKIEYYNKVGKLDKLIIYKKGQPFNTVIYQYKKGRLIQQKLYNLINELERIITFEYGLDAKTKLPIKKEHGFDRKKQYLGSIVTYYNSQGQITRKEFYDHSKLLYEIIHFDSMGNVARTEKAENRDN